MLESDKLQLKRIRQWMRHLALVGHPRGVVQGHDGAREILDLVDWMDEYLERTK